MSYKYILNKRTGKWDMVSESATADWSTITNKPSSPVIDIDDAVDKKHTQNTDNTLLYSEGEIVTEQEEENDWEEIAKDLPKAQTIPVLRIGKLTKISIIARPVSSPNSPFIMEIRTTNEDGTPTDTVLGSVSKTPGELNPEDFVDFIFAIDVLEGKYAIVMKTNATIGNYDVKDYNVESIYEGGQWYNLIGENWILEDRTLAFKFYITYETAVLIENGIFKQNLLIDSIKKFGIGIDAPTASLHIRAGSANGNTAPIKLKSGELNTIPEKGSIEYDGDNIYFVDDNGDRHQLAVVE